MNLIPANYCKEFLDLFNPDDDPYPESFSGKISDAIQDVFLSGFKDCKAMKALYDEFSLNGMKPFHLGLGNPDAKLLIVGHEQAIDSNRVNPAGLSITGCDNKNYYRDLYVNESILNYFLWKFKVQGNQINANCCLQDPQFPSSFCHLYNTEKTGGHYWRNVNKITGDFQATDAKFKSNTYTDSFFSKVFLTEIHSTPSRKSPSKPDKDSIKTKLKALHTIPFFRKFEKIIFSCNSYLKKNVYNLDAVLQNEYEVSLVTKGISRNIKAMYSNGNRKVVLCNNLSGAAGWSNSELEILKEIIA